MPAMKSATIVIQGRLAVTEGALAGVGASGVIGDDGSDWFPGDKRTCDIVFAHELVRRGKAVAATKEDAEAIEELGHIAGGVAIFVPVAKK